MTVRVNRAGKTICPRDWNWDTQDLIKDFDIWTAIKGQGLLTAGSKTYAIAPGDCFILRRNERYFFEQNSQYPLIVFYIHYDYIDNKGQPLMLDDVKMPPFHRKVDKLTFFMELLERVVASHRKGMNYCHEAEQWLKTVLLEIGTYDRTPVLSGFEMEQSNLIENICTEVMKDPASVCSINQLALKYSYTPDHLCRLFKKYKGIAPSQFILTAKMELARTLLKASNYSVSRISEFLGYKDVYFFSRQFHLKTGLTPSDYRKK